MWWFEIKEGDFDLFSLVVLLWGEEGGSNVCSGDKDVVLEEFGLQTLAEDKDRRGVLYCGVWRKRIVRFCWRK